MSIAEIVFNTVQKLGEELGNPTLTAPTLDVRLLGSEGLDSIALVTLIADLEGDLSVSLGKPIVLADERAMSRFHSPFRTVGTLIAHVERIVSETNSAS